MSPIDLRAARDRGTLSRIRAGMDEHAVLVFRDQKLSLQDRRELRRVTTIDVQYDFEDLPVAEAA
ncbi:hypothetical protein D3C83_322210 [compost metagenome]